MRMKIGVGPALALTLLLSACDNPTDPDAKIATLDKFLAKICELAARCTGVSATPADIAACPSELRSELSESKLAELETFTSYTKAQQDVILDCMGTAICLRFSGGLSNISDSDVMEPFRSCRSSV